MYSLRTLKMDFYRNVKNFNIPTILQFSAGLKNLEIHVEDPTDANLEKEMAGELPLSWKISLSVVKGVRSPVLHFCVRNTSILKISSNIFQNAGWAKNLTVDVRDNGALQTLNNPSTGSRPDLYRKTFLMDLKLTGNRWSCDCDLGWVEVWMRKRRQYICEHSPPIYESSPHDSEYRCRQTDDDLRTALCSNKNNNTVIDTLKSDIECGWSSSNSLHGFAISTTLVFGILMRFV
ncbi:unnamed protein product [Callosobruchus maculatus]|uniref:LRRCT domain-containing protein n=1 Tax=Callosobruchus maculatus TaxID=64391 RepID=A0A653DQQ2_CALMS|nr:unnamed protein product [Callosobruchus maculatus]